MSTTAEPLATTPETQLAKVATEAGLVGPARQELIDAFLPDFSSAWNLSVQAKDISVTDPGQKDEIRKARDMRLQLREVRIASEKRRKALKEDSLRRGQAIDKVAKVITQIAEPAEAKLLEMETIAERLEQERRSKLRADRVMQLAPYGVDTTCIDLAGMEDAAFFRLLEDSRLAADAREKAAREAEEKRKADEAAREAERQRLKAENDRLRRENERREAEAKRARDDAARLEREKADREAAEKRAQADAEKARRKAARAPVAQKIRSFAETIQSLERPTLPDEVNGQFAIIMGDCMERLRAFAEELER